MRKQRRGGARPGAGRRPALDAAPAFEAALVERLASMSEEPIPRIALLAAACGASDAELRAALRGDISGEVGEAILTGQSLREANLICLLFAKAAKGDVRAMIYLHKRMAEVGDVDQV